MFDDLLANKFRFLAEIFITIAVLNVIDNKTSSFLKYLNFIETHIHNKCILLVWNFLKRLRWPRWLVNDTHWKEVEFLRKFLFDSILFSFLLHKFIVEAHCAYASLFFVHHSTPLYSASTLIHCPFHSDIQLSACLVFTRVV